MACNGIVIALINCGKWVVFLFALVVHFLDLFRGEVAKAEAFEGAAFVKVINSCKLGGPRDRGVGGMDEVNVNLDSQFLISKVPFSRRP